ncbi:MAG TPA: nif-specific transcriptional activator NifA [Rhodospirillales bacterium]|nr:nif-specific transcriptional activator NifA [Rhodospirillales bacterium]
MAVSTTADTSRSLVSLYEISKILTSSPTLDGALRAVLNLLSSYLQMRHGVVAITGEDGELHVVASAALGKGAASLPREAAERILAGQMPFVTENVDDDPLLADYVRAPGMLDDEKISFIGVPIKTIAKPFGVLAIDRIWSDQTEVNFGDDVRFLTMVANLIAQTVKLHDKMAAAQLQPVNGCGRKVLPLPRPTTKLTYSVDKVIGTSQAMQEVFAQIHLVAPTRSTVLLRGESGTGKELIAKAVHNLSPRKPRAFVKVNCAALPDTLLESELFGHEKGSFTGATGERKGRFELADGGTLFLDEIGDVSPAFQAKLLRVLQEREFERVGGTRTIKVDVRLVCATNRNLEEAVAKGEFRADLYYRINVVPVFIPSLRERREDIPLLAEHFLRAFNAENERKLTFADHAVNVLTSCSFPGNVRELENFVYRAATMTRGEVISDIDLACQSGGCQAAVMIPLPHVDAAVADDADLGDGDAALAGGDGLGLDDLSDLDALSPRERLIRVMEKAGWVQAKAGRLLGMTPRQVGYALRKHNIEIKRL